MVDIFREVRRVLRDDGVLFLNLGDSYNGSQQTGGTNSISGHGARQPHGGIMESAPGLKPKDLVGIPWRVALALQADGWYLRSDIIWSKPNPMPESVTDRPTKAHEYIFLLTKNSRYFWDAEAVKETTGRTGGAPMQFGATKQNGTFRKDVGNTFTDDGTRNLRTVWTIATRPLKEAHFACFPPEIPERCIKAGTSERGCCPACGAPWVRVVERGPSSWEARKASGHKTSGYHAEDGAVASHDAYRKDLRPDDIKHQGGLGWVAPKTTTGWTPTCTCPDHKPVPCTVLDPFGGAGTVAMVAESLGRSWVLCEINPEYVEMIKRRVSGPLFAASVSASNRPGGRDGR